MPKPQNGPTKPIFGLSQSRFARLDRNRHSHSQRNRRGNCRNCRSRAGLLTMVIWRWVKNQYPKWNPGKWKHGLKPVVPWWFYFDPYPFWPKRGQANSTFDSKAEAERRHGAKDLARARFHPRSSALNNWQNLGPGSQKAQHLEIVRHLHPQSVQLRPGLRVS